MPTAAEEALKLLTDFNTSDVQSLAAQGQLQAAQRELLLTRDTSRRQTQASINAEAKQAADDEADFLEAQTIVQTEARKLDLNGDQVWLSRVSGEFDAVIDLKLQERMGKARSDDERRRLNLARTLLQQDVEIFKQNNPDQNVVDYRTVNQDRVKDLASKDGFGGFIAKAATTAVAGIPGLAGIAAGAVGLEDTAQALGGAASTIAGLAPTDLGSSAASQQGADIQARVESGELSLGEGASQLAQLALTDGDFAGDLLGTTLGAAAGGGVVGGAARGAARLAGGAAGNTAAATTVGGRIAQGTAASAPAVGVGLGAGIDETITTPQAQVLAGTLGLSALTGGLTAGLGGQVAETALGSLARRIPGAGIVPGVTAPSSGARTVAGALTPRTTGQIAGRAAGSTVTSAAGEAGQEFIESGGESLATSARGGLGDIDSEALRTAGIAGTLAAPLGAGLGGAVGGVSNVADSRATNRATRAEVAGNRAALTTARAEGIADNTAALDAQRQAEAPQFNQGLEQATAIDEQDAAVNAQVEALNAEFTEAFGPEIPFSEDVPRNQVGTRAPVRATIANALNPVTLEGPAFNQALDRFQADPISLRALYRNQLQETPGVLQRANEDQFVQAVAAIPSEASTTQAKQAVQAAFVAAGNAPIESPVQGQSADTRQALSDQAVSGFVQGIAEAPANEAATDTTPIDTRLAQGAEESAAREQVAADSTQSEADRTRIAQQAAAAAIQTQQLNTQQQQAAVAEVFGNNFEKPETTGATRGELRAVRNPQPTVSNTLGAKDQTISDEAFAKLFVDNPASTQNIALEGLLRNTNPALSAEQASTLANQIVDATEAQGDALTKESALAEIERIVASPNFAPAANDPDLDPDTDPTPPATAASVPVAPVIEEAPSAVSTENIFDGEQVAARYQDDFDKLSSPVGPTNEDLKAFREGGKLLDAEGVTGFKPKTLRTLAQKAREAKTILAEGGTLTPTQKGQLVNGIDKFRRAIARGKPEAAEAAGTGSSYTGKEGTHLEGLPKSVVADGVDKVFTGLKSAQDAARAYMQSTGRAFTPIRTYQPVDTARAKRIADAFEAMEHTPNDPATAASYRAMIDETYGQYQAMLDAGVVVEFNNGTDPYGNPRNAILDVVENNHMFVFSTQEGFGTDTVFNPDDSPMLEVSPFTFGNQPALANDIFRAVHDYFGHIQHGLGFRSRGEDNAWRSHATMYSAAARPAATTETRGQNSWVNFGPFAEANSTASGAETRFADQKIGLLPDWVMEDAEIAFSTDTPTYKERATTEQSSEVQPNPPTNRASRAAVSSSAVSVNRPSAYGLLPEGASTQVQQFFQSDVQGIVDRVVKSWKAKPRIVVVETTADLPPALQDGNENAGMTDGKTMYLIASNLTSEAQVLETLLEETFHKGIQKTLGGNYDPVLDRIFKTRGGVDGMLALVSKYDGRSDFAASYRDVISEAQLGNKDAQRELVDEALAQIALSPNLPAGPKAALKAIIAQIKKAIRKVFPQMLEQYSDNDLHQLIRDANNAGRSSGDPSQPLRVRAARGLKEGEYYGTDPATGERKIFSAGTGADRRIPDLRSEAVAGVESVRQAINPDSAPFASWRGDNSRGSGIGPAIFRSDAWQAVNRVFANAKIALERLETELDFQPAGTAESLVDSIAAQESLPDMVKEVLALANTAGKKQALMAVNSLVSTYQSRANYLARKDLTLNVNGTEGTLYDFMQTAGDSRAAIQNAEGLNDTETKQQLGIFANAEHAPERNSTMWARSVILNDTDATAERTAILAKIDGNTVTPADWARVQELAQQFSTIPEADYVGSGLSNAEAANIIANIPAELLPLYRQAAQDLRNVQQAANEIKKATGSYSVTLDNTIELYGWQNYVPLRGRGVNLDEDIGDAFTAYYSDNEFSTTYRSAEGRSSLTGGIVDAIYRNGTQAIIQLAAQDLIESVAVHATGASSNVDYQEALQRDGEGGQLLAGDVREFDMNSPEFKSAMKTKRPEQLVLYDKNNSQNPDNQRATIVTLLNPKGVDAVMGAKSEAAEGVDNLLRKATVGGKSIHDVTSFTASLKTMRNLPFIPFDALRNILTLGYVSSTEGGGEGINKYISAFTAPGENYAKRIMDFTSLFADNNFAEIDRQVAEKPEGMFAQLDEFYKLGGPVNFLNAIRERVPGDLEGLSESGNTTSLKGKAAARVREADKLFTKLNMAADTLSRFAFYKSLVEQGVPKEVAAARAKNTANFEKRGTWSGPLGGLFEFFRATAVGSTALINSTLNGEYGAQTAAGAFGAGAALYLTASMFAGVDDEGDDRMAQVNGSLFNNNFVFQFGDSPQDRIQIGLGFGPIASAVSSGVHAARLMLGHADIANTLDNVSSAIVNQYKVVPASSISPLDTLDFVASSITPSILKPWAEVNRNLTSLGIPVRSDYAGADSGDLTGSFAGRYGSEQEMYERVTQSLSDSGFANINPDDFKHIMRSYGGTLSYLAEAVFENVQAATSEDFAYNKKQGLYIARQFFGSTYSQRPADFYEHFGRVGELDDQANKFDERGNAEAAEAIRSSDIYANNVDLYKSVEKELLAINKEYKPIFRDGSTTTAEKRQVEAERNERRNRVFKDYLDQIQ